MSKKNRIAILGMLLTLALADIHPSQAKDAKTKEKGNPPSPNLVKNPGFEDAATPVGWSFVNWANNNAEGVIDTHQPHSGKQCLRLAMNKVLGVPNIQFIQQIAAKPNLPLSLKFWLRGRANARPMAMQFRKMGWPYTTYYRSEVRITEKWQLHEFQVAMPPNTDSNDTGVFFELNDENTCWLDDVSVQIMPAADTAPPLAGNQVHNGSFETGTAQWSATFREFGIAGTQAAELNAVSPFESAAVGGAPHGQHAFRTKIAPGCIMQMTSSYFPLRYGHPATIGLWVKAPAAGNSFTLKLMSGKWPPVEQFAQSFTASKADWEFFSFTTTPKMSNSQRYFIQIEVHQPGEFLIDSVTAIDGTTPLKSAAPHGTAAGFLPLGQPGNVVFKDSQAVVTVVVESDKNKDVSYVARIQDAWEHDVDNKRVDIPIKNHAGRGTISLPTNRFGCFRVELFSGKDFLKVPEADMIYSVVPRLTSPKESTDRFFGGHMELVPNSLTLAERMGVRSLRLHPPVTTKWQTIHKYGYALDGIKRAHALGFSIVGNFDSVPPEFADAPPDTPTKDYDQWWNSYAPKDYAQWKKYVKETYQTYGPYISEWEVWNEPDGGFLQVKPGLDKVRVYTDIVAQTRTALEDNGIKITLVGGVVSSMAPPFMKTALEYGMNQNVDAASFHFYGEDLSPDEVLSPTLIERVQEMQKLAGRSGKPLEVWHTEGAAWIFEGMAWRRSLRVPSGASVTPLNAASGLVRTMISLKAVGVKRHHQYAGFTSPSGRIINRDECASLFESSGEALPGVAAHAGTVLLLENAIGKGLVEKRVGPAKVVICQFEKNGKPIEAVWSRVPIKAGEAGITFRGKTCFDMMGNAIKLGPDFLLTETPVYLVTP